MTRVILDTNALMAIDQFKLDVFTELRYVDPSFEITILDGTIEELHKIMVEQKGKYRRSAKLALDIIEAKKIESLPSSGNVDDALVEHSEAGDLVVTQDVELKKRLCKPYLTIRQKKKIIVVS